MSSNSEGQTRTYRALSRKFRMPKLIAASAVLVACVFASALTLVATAAPTASHPRSYSITDLGTLGGLESYASAINNRGQIVGDSSLIDTSFHAFLYEPGRMTDLFPGPTTSHAIDINNRGEIVGILGTRAFLYRRGQVTLIGLGGAHSSAFGINDRGDVVGYSDLLGGPPFVYHAFLYRNERAIDLTPTLPTEGEFAPSSFAQDINDRGVVVGYTSQVFVEDTQPFLWRKGTLADLPLALPGELAIPSRINNAGDVVGVSFTGTGDVLHAVLLRRGRLISLGLGAATSINNRGDVVGGGPDGAFLSQKGTRIELNSVLPADSGWRLSTATDTNERGQIVGFGEHNGAFFRAFLLSPSREEDDD